MLTPNIFRLGFTEYSSENVNKMTIFGRNFVGNSNGIQGPILQTNDGEHLVTLLC
jgi:hypothetical protein